MPDGKRCSGVVIIGDTRIARAHAYVYCGYSRKLGVAYVGMTLDRRGLLGRWIGHLAGEITSSSFRRRLHEWDESAWESLDDLTIFWADIGDSPEFLTTETSHRESVEYMVQREIRVLVAGGSWPLRLISVVRSNSTASLPVVYEAAEFVIAAFREHYFT